MINFFSDNIRGEDKGARVWLSSYWAGTGSMTNDEIPRGNAECPKLENLLAILMIKKCSSVFKKDVWLFKFGEFLRHSDFVLRHFSRPIPACTRKFFALASLRMDENLPPFNNPPQPSPPPPLASAPPPPVIAPPAISKPAKKSGRGWKIFSLILLIALGFSLLGNFHEVSHVGNGAVQRGTQPLDEIILENNRSDKKIAIVEVEGIITDSIRDRSARSLVESIRDQLKTAGRDPFVKAVVLKVNSPGGEVLASDEIYNSIREFQEIYNKPVVASMGTLAASGGYYVSAPCRWIVANEMTITGSIGVIMHGYNYRGLMDKIGLRPEVYKSGKFKNMLSGDRKEEEIPEEEREMVQSLIDETYGKFTNVVAAGRMDSNRENNGKGQKLAADWTDYADGRVLSGKQALQLGLVDELGNFRKAVERAEDLAHVRKANLIQYEEPFGLGNLFRIFGKTEVPPTAIKVDLGLDFPKLQLGRMYFIAPTTLP
jgi:protease-4